MPAQYFANFPTVFKKALPTDAQRVLVVDILKSVAMHESALQMQDMFYAYVVGDGERPEHVADKVYGNPALGWVILLVNQVEDPFFGWALDSLSLDNYLTLTYPGQTYIIDQNTAVVVVEDGSSFTAGGNVTCATESVNTTANLLWAESNTLYLSRINNTSSPTDYLPVGNNITQEGVAVSEINSVEPHRGVTIGNTLRLLDNGNLSSIINNWSADLGQVSIQNSSLRYQGYVGRLAEYDSEGVLQNVVETALDLPLGVSASVQTVDAPHHWENADEDEVPRSYTGIQARIYYDSELNKTDFGATYPVSNREWEIYHNDKHRHIRLLDPKYVHRFVNEVQKKLRQ